MLLGPGGRSVLGKGNEERGLPAKLRSITRISVHYRQLIRRLRSLTLLLTDLMSLTLLLTGLKSLTLILISSLGIFKTFNLIISVLTAISEIF